MRRAIVRAFEVAQAGESARPTVPAPAPLRPVLRFTRLPARAQATVLQVLESDDAFRARVAEAVDRDEVGRAAWLWLRRPDGWEDELAAVLDELAGDLGLPERERDADKVLRRRVEGAERAAAREQQRADRAEADLERTRRDLVEVRRAHDALAARVAELEIQVTTLTAERRAAVSSLKRVEAMLNRRTDEKRALAERVAQLEASAAASAPTEPGEVSSRAAVEPSVDAAALRALLERLGRATQELTSSVDAVRETLGAAARDANGARNGGGSGGGAVGSHAAPEPSAPARRHRATPTRTPRRSPAPIPGLPDDSGEAAAHLLSRPGAVLLVDGYNVSMKAWPDVDIAEQRVRLEGVLADLAARMPTLTIEVVFDGAEVVPLARAVGRRVHNVTVRFTAPDVEADDELLELVDRLPHDRVVIVASDDRRVRDGARRRGANVLRCEQLLAVARGS